jgi:hypothetical protein
VPINTDVSLVTAHAEISRIDVETRSMVARDLRVLILVSGCELIGCEDLSAGGKR